MFYILLFALSKEFNVFISYFHFIFSLSLVRIHKKTNYEILGVETLFTIKINERLSTYKLFLNTYK